MCKHSNSVIHEEWLIERSYVIESGKWDGDGKENDGSPTGHWRINCRDCGLEKRYPPGKHPKWLKARIELILNRTDV